MRGPTSAAPTVIAPAVMAVIAIRRATRDQMCRARRDDHHRAAGVAIDRSARDGTGANTLPLLQSRAETLKSVTDGIFRNFSQIFAGVRLNSLDRFLGVPSLDKHYLEESCFAFRIGFRTLLAVTVAAATLSFLGWMFAARTIRPTDAGPTVCTQAQVDAIFDAKCTVCHDGTGSYAGLDLTSSPVSPLGLVGVAPPGGGCDHPVGLHRHEQGLSHRWQPPRHGFAARQAHQQLRVAACGCRTCGACAQHHRHRLHQELGKHGHRAVASSSEEATSRDPSRRRRTPHPDPLPAKPGRGR